VKKDWNGNCGLYCNQKVEERAPCHGALMDFQEEERNVIKLTIYESI
jgi:hypothetical protein